MYKQSGVNILLVLEQCVAHLECLQGVMHGCLSVLVYGPFWKKVVTFLANSGEHYF